jgi:hypothetical protein
MKQTVMRGLANGKSKLIPKGTPFSLTVLIYYFAPNGFGQPAQRHPAKAASAVFFDGRLVAYATDSAIPGQANAPIDETRLGALHQGETTREQAIALLGTPNGQLLHLLDAQRGATELTYTWLNNDGETVQRRTLHVLFDSAGALTTYSLLDNSYPAGSQPIPLPHPHPPPPINPRPPPRGTPAPPPIHARPRAAGTAGRPRAHLMAAMALTAHVKALGQSPPWSLGPSAFMTGGCWPACSKVEASLAQAECHVT